jgi:hypothetical protein
MLCLTGNNGDLKITPLADVTRGCNSGNTVTNDDDVFHALQKMNLIHYPMRQNNDKRSPSKVRRRLGKI